MSLVDHSAPRLGKISPVFTQSLLFGVLVLAAFFGAQHMDVVVIERQDFLLRLLATLMTTFAVALLLERATEVLISVLCGPQEMRITVLRDKRAAHEQDVIDREKAVLATLQSPEERMTYLTTGRGAERLSSITTRDEDGYADSTQSMVALKTRKLHVASLSLTVLGGVVAFGGLRLLDATLELGQIAAGQGQQAMLLRGLDVVVTTLVLGGCARGIHELIQRIKPR